MQTQSKMRNVYNQITVSDITDPTGSSYLTQQCQTTWHNRVKLLDPWGSRMIPQPGLQIYFWPHVTLTSVFDLSKSSGGCFCPKGRNLMPVEMVKALMTWLNAVQRWKVDGARQKISHRHWTMCQILHRKKNGQECNKRVIHVSKLHFKNGHFNICIHACGWRDGQWKVYAIYLNE